jgi:hypothetical protein
MHDERQRYILFQRRTYGLGTTPEHVGGEGDKVA